MATRVVDEVNAFAATWTAPLNKLYEAIPGAGSFVDETVGPKLKPLGLTELGIRFLAVTCVVFIALLLATLLDLLAIFFQSTSVIIAGRNAIVALEHRSGDAKPLLMYLVLMMGFDFLEGTPASALLRAIPFFGLIKGVFLFVCSVPTSGVSMKVYNAAFAQLFSPGGRFAVPPTPSAKVLGGTAEPTKVVCTVKSGANLPSGDLYCIMKAKPSVDSDGVFFKTSASATGTWNETICVPKDSRTEMIDVSVMSKQQFGSDTLVGSCVAVILEVSLAPKNMNLNVADPSGAECGSLTLEMCVE